MKQMDAYVNFWKDPANPGFNTYTPGNPAGEIDAAKIAKMTQTEYAEYRKKGKISHAATRR